MLKRDENDTREDRPNDNTDNHNTEDNAGEGYKVGRGRPPLQTRFKPGRSGNPNGRPLGSANVGTSIKRIINKKVTVREGKKTRKVTMFEAALHAHAVKATQGDARSANLFFGTVQKMGLLTDQPINGDAQAGGGALIALPPPRPPSSELFENIDLALLSDGEKIELSRLAEIVDRDGGICALRVDDFARVREIINKGRGENGSSGR
jgi:hypothetical protein